jgi:GH24 family phage-related lysozyme (muramidase)
MIDHILEAAAICRHFEGFRAKPYQDAGRGIWTIGYGSTRTRVDGVRFPVTADTPPVDISVAYLWLIADVGAASSNLSRIPGSDRLNGWERAAMCSLIYNVGYSRIGTKVKDAIWRISDGRHPDHPNKMWAAMGVVDLADALLLYRKAGGKVFPGLVRRRMVEAATMLDRRCIVPNDARPSPEPWPDGEIVPGPA